jgi:iron-sulfur cluster assembly protein
MALFSIVGTTMDWEENELASEFTFKNPNSKGECGCGESFTV